MDRPPLAPIKKENNSAQYSISSPGPGKHPICPHNTVSTPTPRKQNQPSCITNSPFREWAKSNLSNFDHDSASFSPSRGFLSPLSHHAGKLTSPELRVRVKEENSRVDNDDSSLQRTIDSPYVLSYDEYHQRDVSDEKALTPKKEIFEQPTLTSSSASNVSQATPILRRLQIVDLLSFELVDGKVETHGFAMISPCSDSSFLRVRRQPSTVPATPGFGLAPGGDDLDSKVRICSCKKSRCLKLYCECFAASELCQGCKCMDCANDGEHEAEREDAVERIKQRSVNAFAPKIVEEMRQDKTMHARGCRCKKSHCLKKYCECYQAGVRCGDNCRCEDCHNMSAAAASSSTPRERRSAEHMRPLVERIPLSPIGRVEMDRGGIAATVTPDEDEEEDTESPSPRAKRPRMLDFNMAATPVHTNSCSVLEQDSPDRRLEAYGHYNMFGSPSSLFLPN